jgi:hypothetical protein
MVKQGGNTILYSCRSFKLPYLINPKGALGDLPVNETTIEAGALMAGTLGRVLSGLSTNGLHLQPSTTPRAIADFHCILCPNLFYRSLSVTSLRQSELSFRTKLQDLCLLIIAAKVTPPFIQTFNLPAIVCDSSVVNTFRLCSYARVIQ